MKNYFLVPMLKTVHKSWKTSDYYSKIIDRVITWREAKDFVEVVKKAGEARSNVISMVNSIYVAPALDMRDIIEWKIYPDHGLIMLECEDRGTSLQKDYLKEHQIPFVCNDGSASEDDFGADNKILKILKDYMSLEKDKKPMGFQNE